MSDKEEVGFERFNVFIRKQKEKYNNHEDIFTRFYPV